MTWLAPWDVGVKDCPLRGLWGWFLDWLQVELAALRADCDAAGRGPESFTAHERYASHLRLMEWAAREIDRLYLLDRQRVTVDWAWDRGPGQTVEFDANQEG